MQDHKGGRTRRAYQADFKARLVQECRRTGVSTAAVAQAHGINANLLRRWIKEATPLPVVTGRAAATPAPFIPVPIIESSPAPTVANDIRIELRRGDAQVVVRWPIDAADTCRAWLQDWLR